MNDDPVAAVMAAVDRADFLPEAARDQVDADRPIAIGHGQTNSQPRTVANMLRLLEVRRGQRVLDVGAGSGWTTTLLGCLVGPQGHVVGVELEPELARWGAANVATYAMPWVELLPADPHRLGLLEGAPYDRILVSAAARTLPPELVEQLAVDGVMVIPVRGTMLRVVRRSAEPPKITRHGWYRFVPLR